MATQTEISGTITRVYHAGSTWSSGRLRDDQHGQEFSFSGNLFAQVNQRVTLQGVFDQHPKFGRQFKVSGVAPLQTMDAQGIAAYLEKCPEIKHIGPVKARRLAHNFAADWDTALDTRTSEMAAVAGVQESVIMAIRHHWRTEQHTIATRSWLAGLGLTFHQIEKLIEALGNGAKAIIQVDPYVLLGHVPDFGFSRLDHVARQTGASKTLPSRIRAGIIHTVREALDQGHTCTMSRELIHEANLLLAMDELDSKATIERELYELVTRGALVSYTPEEWAVDLIALPVMLAEEKFLAAFLRYTDESEAYLEYADEVADLNEDQMAAWSMVRKSAVSIITGGAGTGKSYLIAHLANSGAEHGQKVLLCAPTGKAAKRLEELEAGPAATIHRMLGFDGKDWAMNADNPLDADLLIVDEVSMMDTSLACRLFSAVDQARTRVVLVGDHNQLPPVGAGNVLRDALAQKMCPSTELTQVMRQAGTLKRNSIELLSGRVAPDTEKGVWYRVANLATTNDVAAWLDEAFRTNAWARLGWTDTQGQFHPFDALRDVQVLTPTHVGPIGTVALNVMLQRIFQAARGVIVEPPVGKRRPSILPGDKVIQTKNDYKTGLMNGASGICVDDSGKELTFEFDGVWHAFKHGSDEVKRLQLAYAMTAHKAQGSEYPCVVVVCHKAHSFMLHRNWLYTAVTRARKCAIVLGDGWGIKNAAEKVESAKRRTFLSTGL
jgi:exodeoxyribonuclease V alpha subunit